MELLIPLLLIGVGLILIFYIRPKTKNSITEIKFLQTKTISDLKKMFEQMKENGLDNDYRELVELKGNIVSDNLIETPYSNRKVAYCESKILQVTEIKEQYKDSNGNYRTRVRKQENTISNETSSHEISLVDHSTKEPVVIEINGVGCNLDIPKTFDRFEPKANMRNYKYFGSFSWNGFGAETLGFKMIEKTIEKDQSLYVIGEAFKVGKNIHIGKPQDKKKPFIVTTKSEEDLINTSNRNSIFQLLGGISLIILGIIMFCNLM